MRADRYRAKPCWKKCGVCTKTPTRAPSTTSSCGCAATSDRKSTRLNSSHLGISYAVFCLEKIEQHALGLGQRQDAVQRIVHRVDEARRALRLAIAGHAKFNLLLYLVPVPVLRVGVGLDAV